MREIKFRAWHKDREFMLFVGDDWGTTKPLDCCVYAVQKQPVILMQFTGLHDKNGKEIYEGDCLDGVFGECYIGYCDKCKSFELIANDFGCLSCEGDIFWRDVVEESPNAEVIGNIYENPELLK